MAGSAIVAIITSRLEPMPPKLVPISSPASARRKRGGTEQGDDGDEIGGPGEDEPRGEGRHERGANPGRGEDKIRNGAEQPGRIVGEDHFLAQEPDEVAIGLEEGRALAKQETGP